MFLATGWALLIVRFFLGLYRTKIHPSFNDLAIFFSAQDVTIFTEIYSHKETEGCGQIYCRDTFAPDGSYE